MNNILRVARAIPARSLHTSVARTGAPAPAAAAAHHDHDHHHENLGPEPANGWFLGQYPGYKGNVLPGNTFRNVSNFFAYCAIISSLYMIWIGETKPNTNVNVWYKEYVLNKEKLEVPAVSSYPN